MKLSELLVGERARVGLASGLGAASSLAGVGLLATSAWLISRAAERPLIGALGVAIAGVRFFALSRALARYGERLAGHDAALRMLAQLRVRVYSRLEELSPSTLSKFHKGDLLTRLVDDVDSLQDYPLRVVIPCTAIALAGIFTVLLIGTMLSAAAIVLAITLLTAGLAVPRITQSLTHKSEAKLVTARSKLKMSTVDLIEGAADLTAFGRMSSQVELLINTDHELTSVASRTAFTTGLGGASMILLTGTAIIAAIIAGIPAVASGELDSVLLAVVVLTPLAVFESFAALPTAARVYERVQQSASRVSEVVDSQIRQPPRINEPLNEGRDIRINDLHARYDDGGSYVINGLDLELTAGRRVAVVGPSGGGKSTLAITLLGFLPYEGSATIGDVEIANLNGDELRREIGMVAQDAHIFNSTLRENLRLAKPNATDEELGSALSRVHLDRWLNELPNGLDTEVGNQGMRLSGGIRQRVAVARAVLANFPILILDEPGEHLDIETADALTADLIDLTQGQTTMLITHRLVGLEAMDEIVVIDHGQIVERGTHDELVNAQGWYSSAAST